MLWKLNNSVKGLYVITKVLTCVLCRFLTQSLFLTCSSDVTNFSNKHYFHCDRSSAFLGETVCRQEHIPVSAEMAAVRFLLIVLSSSQNENHEVYRLFTAYEGGSSGNVFHKTVFLYLFLNVSPMREIFIWINGLAIIDQSLV